MIKLVSVIVGFLVFSLNSNAQFDTAFSKHRVLTCADSLAQAVKKKNWDLYVRYSYPAMIGTFGGTENFRNYIISNLSLIPDSAYKRYEPGNVLQIVKTPGDQQAIVEMHSVIEIEGRRISNTFHLVAESWDGGFFWTFFDSQNDKISASLLKPDLDPSLVIPPKVEKVEQLPKKRQNP